MSMKAVAEATGGADPLHRRETDSGRWMPYTDVARTEADSAKELANFTKPYSCPCGGRIMPSGEFEINKAGRQ